MSARVARIAALPLVLAACSTAQAPPAAEAGPAAPTTTATANAATASAPEPTSPATAAAAAPSAAPTVEPSATAAAPASSAPAPLPSVKVANIGMHIGGGPNDAVTKEPIKKSVEPHFDEFRRCFGLLDDKKAGDFGVDLRIGKDGGKAKVSHPRTALKGEKFERCVIDLFESIEFLKPKGGDTTVSYSLRFTP